MVIDIILLVLLAMALWKGYNRGLIVAVFSLLGIIIGLAAAMKLSVVVAVWLKNSTHIGQEWIPFLSFALVMIAVVLLVKWLAAFVEKTVQFVMLGWLNKLGGILLYSILYITIYSIVLFYCRQIGIFKPETIGASKSYIYLEPFGPKAINAIATVLPFFRDMFSQLTDFFSSVSIDS